MVFGSGARMRLVREECLYTYQSYGPYVHRVSENSVISDMNFCLALFLDSIEVSPGLASLEENQITHRRIP